MEEKKRYIIKNAASIYNKRGVKNATMDDVASGLGISKKTLYLHFRDKRDLVTQVVNYFIEETDKKLNNISGNENAIEWYFAIRKSLSFVLQYYNSNVENDLIKTYPELYEKIRETKLQRIFTGAIGNLKQGIAEGLYRNDLDPYFIAKIMVGRTLFTMNPNNNVFENYEVNSIAFFDSVMDYHIHAICTEKGIEYYKKQLNKVQNENN